MLENEWPWKEKKFLSFFSGQQLTDLQLPKLPVINIL